MDHGTLTDNNGRPTDFRHAVLIMTSNVGAHALTTTRLGFGNMGVNVGEEDRILKATFSPEFRNRLDARIQFKPLNPEVMGQIVDKFMRELSAQLTDRRVSISIEDDARAYLADKGYDALMGARPLARIIDQEVKRELSNEILFGKLEHGGKVSIGVEPVPDAERDADAEETPSANKKLSFRYQPLAPGEGKLLGDGGSGDRKALPTSRSDEPEIEVDESEESVDESVN
jgi:ATP-dependent Clp protease ATP-binding subunit ClpA